MKEVVWLENKIDEVFYPSDENVLKDETDAYRQTFKYLLLSLEVFLSNNPDLNLDANIGVFYEERNLREFVCFDVVAMNNPRQEKRSSYCTWKDEFKPQVAFKILKEKNPTKSVNRLEVLKNVGVKEQYIFDPEYDFFPNGLIAYHLKNGEFEEIKINNSRIFSPALGLEIVDTDKMLRLFNPETREFLPTMEELTQQATKVETLESEIEQLKAELAKLKRQN
ncbi:MAG: hypothetical protein ACR2MG_12655 [Pyrinomonadaceae bacterium]